MKIDDRISGKTRLIGLIGDPVAHTLSPHLHNSMANLLGIEIAYIPFNVKRGDLEDAVKGLKAINALGFNVTVPYKRDIMKYIDDNARETFLMGSINTVKNIDGRLYGYNTDAEGFSKAFKEETGLSFKGKKVVLIGAGGVARSIAVKMAKEGVEKISLVNRTISKASDIAEIINDNINEVVQIYNPSDRTFKFAFEESDIIINSTSVGLDPNIMESPMGENKYFSSNQIVYDLIYNPAKTKFLKDAEKTGCKILNGLGMLFYQGIYAFEIWTGVKISESVLKDLVISFKNYLDVKEGF